MFASMRIYFDDAASIVGGARISNDSTDTEITIQNTLLQQSQVLSTHSRSHRVVTPYAGLMYTFVRHYSLYASYADIYLAQNRLLERTPGNLLGPIRGVNLKAGVKGDWRGGALNASLALYRIEQSNWPKQTSFSAPQDLSAPECCFTGVSNRSRGVDVEVNGEVMSGWKVGAGYTYNVYDFPPSHPLATVTPKHLLKAWTNVRLPGDLSRWEIGGSLHAQSKIESSVSGPVCPAPTFECLPVVGVQPAYAVLDLRAAFEVDRHWRVALSLNNVFDKRYYESIELLKGWYGEPRNWMLRIDGRY